VAQLHDRYDDDVVVDDDDDEVKCIEKPAETRVGTEF
jgi:hypothetical protein